MSKTSLLSYNVQIIPIRWGNAGHLSKSRENFIEILIQIQGYLLLVLKAADRVGNSVTLLDLLTPGVECVTPIRPQTVPSPFSSWRRYIFG